MNPCIDYCYLRLHQQYDPIRCDDSCEYAKVIKENKELKQKIEELKTQHDKTRARNQGTSAL